MDTNVLMSWIWLALLAVMVVIEALTMGLTTIWGAISALVMVFVSRTGMEIGWQILLFLAITLVLLLTTRPFALRKLNMGRVKTNVNSMIGEEVELTEPISKFRKGVAKSRNGVLWTAMSEDPGEEIPAGRVCVVSKVEGNTLTVRQKEE